MIELIIGWLGAVAIVFIACRATVQCIKLHYTNEKEKRLERYDRALVASSVSVQQIDGPSDESPGEAEITLNEIVAIANTRCSTAGVASEIVDLLAKHKLITSQRAHFIKS